MNKPAFGRSALGATALLALSALLLGSCFGGETASLEGRVRAAYTGPAHVADWILQGRNDFLLIDLRPEAAFAEAHIPGAVTLQGRDPASPSVLRSLPSYKKLVFYDAGEIVDDHALLPVFQSGAHVMILSGGYAAWTQQVLNANDPKDARMLAIGKHFRGESTLGEVKTVDAQEAESYLQQPALPIQNAQPLRLQTEGC